MKKPIFRWALWGGYPAKMLAESILTFKCFFGNMVEYIVASDDVAKLSSELSGLAKVVSMKCDDFNEMPTGGTWEKWLPRAKLDLDVTEIFVDSDFFLLKEPDELFEFVFKNNGRWDFIAATETYSVDWIYGNFRHFRNYRHPPINAGLLGQAMGIDISNELSALRKSIQLNRHHSHDEQGAVMTILQHYFDADRVFALNCELYRVVCEFNADERFDVSQLKALHATHTGHKAYGWFYKEIAKIAERGRRSQ